MFKFITFLKESLPPLDALLTSTDASVADDAVHMALRQQLQRRSPFFGLLAGTHGGAVSHEIPAT